MEFLPNFQHEVKRKGIFNKKQSISAICAGIDFPLNSSNLVRKEPPELALEARRAGRAVGDLALSGAALLW
jgi:hypothetical protein